MTSNYCRRAQLTLVLQFPSQLSLHPLSSTLCSRSRISRSGGRKLRVRRPTATPKLYILAPREKLLPRDGTSGSPGAWCSSPCESWGIRARPRKTRPCRGENKWQMGRGGSAGRLHGKQRPNWGKGEPLSAAARMLCHLNVPKILHLIKRRI